MSALQDNNVNPQDSIFSCQTHLLPPDIHVGSKIDVNIFYMSKKHFQCLDLCVLMTFKCVDLVSLCLSHINFLSFQFLSLPVIRSYKSSLKPTTSVCRFVCNWHHVLRISFFPLASTFRTLKRRWGIVITNIFLIVAWIVDKLGLKCICCRVFWFRLWQPDWLLTNFVCWIPS